MSDRDVEGLLADRGIDVSYESVRLLVLKFGQAHARRIRKRRPTAFDHWQIDEVFVNIGGKQIYLWRALDGEGEVLDILVQKRASNFPRPGDGGLANRDKSSVIHSGSEFRLPGSS